VLNFRLDEMATVRVTLPQYQRSWDLSRESILSVIPEIHFENPDVTPEAMQVIADYLEGREPPHHVPSLVTAARYLNIPWLNYYADPLYDRVDRISTPQGTVYDTEGNRDLLRQAAKMGHKWMVKYLLLRGVSPVESIGQTGVVWSQALFGAVEGDNLEMVKLLLEDPRVEATTERLSEYYPQKPTKFSDEIGEAINNHSFTVARWMLQQAPDFDYKGNLSDQVEESTPDLDIIKFLLALAPLDTNFKYTLIKVAAEAAVVTGSQNKSVIQMILDSIPE
jgi:hypothetical protein